MSIEALNWAERVFKTLDMPSTDRFVLVALCYRHNKKTGECYPSVETLCKYTGCSESTVRRSIKKLSKWGLVEVKMRTQKGRQTSNKYFLFGVPKVPEKVARGVSLKPPRRGVTQTPLKASSMTPNKEGIYTTSEADCGNVVRFPSQKKGFGDV
jgi:biotin operon repressor